MPRAPPQQAGRAKTTRTPAQVLKTEFERRNPASGFCVTCLKTIGTLQYKDYEKAIHLYNCFNFSSSWRIRGAHVL